MTLHHITNSNLDDYVILLDILSVFGIMLIFYALYWLDRLWHRMFDWKPSERFVDWIFNEK